MACPWRGGSSASGGRGRPSATSSCRRTRSRPVTISVTGCSTCRRVFTSRKAKVPSGRRRNSTVPAPTYPMARAAVTAVAQISVRSARCHGGRGALLDDLLVPSLDGALALEQMDHGSVGVPQDLDLDVAGTGDVGLQEHGAVAEGGRRLPGGRGDGVGQVARALHHAHAPATTPGRRLDQDRPTQFGGRVDQALLHQAAFDGAASRLPRCGRRRPRRPGPADRGENGDAGTGHGRLGRQFRSHGLDDVGGWPHEDESGRLAGPGEAGVLGQEAVAGVDGVGAGRHGPPPPGRRRAGRSRPGWTRADGRLRRPRPRGAHRRRGRSTRPHSRCPGHGRCA